MMSKQIYNRTIYCRLSCYYHLGVHLESFLMELMIDLNLISKKRFELTDTSVYGLESLDVEIKKFI